MRVFGQQLILNLHERFKISCNCLLKIKVYLFYVRIIIKDDVLASQVLFFCCLYCFQKAYEKL